MARWQRSCAYCNGVATHLDHVVPLARGGEDVEANIVPACAPCNLSKGAKTLAEWSETFGPEPPPF
ncbi:HNH endonuclease [Streptomyces mirabilis]|uniref:HNH endonuclease n=1 Tax=Streptomyces mirabilis TaxID=68239 RepID=UPI0036D9B84D